MQPAPLPGSTAAARPSRQDAMLAGLLALLTFIAYWPAIHGGLIMDDPLHLTKISLRSLHGLWRIWFELGATSQYYPLLHSAFWVEYHLWGNAVTGYHLVNIVLHIGSALLLVAIVRRLSIPGAWLAGFLFALHPLCVESVAWISEEKNTVSTIFYLAAALVYLRFDASRERRHYLEALGLFVLALLSKSVTATLPAALLVVFWWERGRLDWKRDFLPMCPLLGIGAGMGLFTAWVERTYIGATGPDFALTAGERILVAGRVVWFYLGKALWPFGYNFVYPRWNVASAPAWQYLFPLGVIALAAGLAWIASRNVAPEARAGRAPLAVLAVFLITQIPVLGFLNVYPFLYSYVWDHFLYLASPVILVAAAAGLTVLLRRSTAPWLSLAAPGVLIAGLGILTLLHARTFRDGATLYADTLRRNPGAWLAEDNLGAALLSVPGRSAEAAEHFRAALRMRPQDPNAHFNLGEVLAAMPGRMPEAIQEYETALALKPDFPEAHNNLGRELARLPGRLQEGIEHLETAVAYNPDFAEAQMNLGAALSEVPGKTGEAIDHLETALRLNPDVPGGKDELELVLSRTPGRSTESVSYFEAQVREHPDSAEAQNGLANALRQEPGRAAEAIAHFREALRLKPDAVAVHMNLANTLARFPDRQAEAIAEYRAVLKLDPHYPDAHNNLGNALAATGRPAEAAREFEAAIADDPSYAAPHVNLGALLLDAPGRVQDAARQFEEAVRLDPQMAEAHADLGYALLRIPGRGADALAELEASLRLKPDPDVQEKVAELRKTAGSGESPAQRSARPEQ